MTIIMNDERRNRMENFIDTALEAQSASDLDIVIQEVAEYTGYSHDFLIDRINESFEDGAEYEDAVTETIMIACELDY